MKQTPTDSFLEAALADDGQPISAGGPPWRDPAEVIAAVQRAKAEAQAAADAAKADAIERNGDVASPGSEQVKNRRCEKSASA